MGDGSRRTITAYVVTQPQTSRVRSAAAALPESPPALRPLTTCVLHFYELPLHRKAAPVMKEERRFNSGSDVALSQRGDQCCAAR